MVREGQIVGQAATAPGSGPHAEPLALEQAGALARGADLYVTLEPCNHHGRNPPCTEAIIAAGISRCYYGFDDPNPESGAGASRLAAAGIEAIRLDGCEPAAEVLKGYLHHQATGRPWVIGKWAMSLDGRVALPGGRRGYLSSSEALTLVHRRRSEVDAVAVGSGTALADDPRLTVRSGFSVSRQPLRVVLDGRARLPAGAAMLAQPGDTICCTGPEAEPAAIRALGDRGCQVLQLAKSPRADPAAVLLQLGTLGVRSVLLEGGPSVVAGFLAAGLIDEIEVFVCPVLVGDSAAPIPIRELPPEFTPPELDVLESSRIGSDYWFRARIGHPGATGRPG